MITHNSYMSGSVTHSREVSMSNSRNILNKNNNNINNFSAVTELLKSGEFGGIIISTQFGLIGTKPHLKIQINNQNIRGLEISKLFISFNKNYIGISTIKNNKNVLYDQIIGYKEKYQFSIGLILNSSESIMESGLIKNNQFDYSAELIINTNGNKNKIKCQLFVPIHLFFTGRGTIPRDQFLQLWKSIPPKQESKLQINKSRSNDMEHIKSLLLIHKLYFIHHRNIPNKGNILYYSAKMYGQILLCEISIALSGKGTVVVRSKDKYKSNLCVNVVQLIVDTKVYKYDQLQPNDEEKINSVAPHLFIQITSIDEEFIYMDILMNKSMNQKRKCFVKEIKGNNNDLTRKIFFAQGKASDKTRIPIEEEHVSNYHFGLYHSKKSIDR
eukprot:532515_1